MESHCHSNLSLQEAVKDMWINQRSCDFTFRVGESRDIVRCHRFIMTCRSPVMCKMVEGDFASDSADIYDVDHSSFYTFIEYLYTDKVSLTSDNVVVLLYMAEKYMVHHLRKLCRDFLIEVGLKNPECVCDIYQQASFFNMTDVKRDSLNVIRQNSVECLKSESFRELSNDCVGEIIDDNCLQIQEEALFDSLLGWAEEECQRMGGSFSGKNMRDVLGDLLYKIRFPLMSEKYFKKKVCKMGILSVCEEKEIYSFLKGNGLSKFSKFKASGRNLRQNINRMETITENIYMDDSKHSLSFSSSQDVFLHGILTYGLCNENKTFEVQVEIEDDNDISVLSQNTEILAAADKQFYEIIFPKALQITCGTKYTISLTFDSIDWLWSGKDAKSHVDCITFEQSRKGTESTNAFEGQIPGIIISYL